MQDPSLPPINLILRRHGNHAAVSGYDRISDYIPARIFPRVDRMSLWQRAVSRALRHWDVNSGSQWYGRAGLITEISVGWQWLRGSGQIFHFVYGENSYRYIGVLKRLRSNHIVCTYHTPPARFKEVVKDRKHLQAIDAVIVVSTVSLGLFGELLGPERVHCIPHGVDTDFFTPRLSPKPEGGPFRCLFVGSHLRDFNLLARLVRHFEQTQSGVEFEIVTLKRDFHYFEGLANVTLRYRISDEELRDAYRDADVLLMPLKDATANNSLLEAMACGLPMIVSDLPGVRDYADESCATFVRVGDCAALAESISRLNADPALRRSMANHARTKALDYSFTKVSRMTEDLYRQVAARDRNLVAA